MTSALASWWHRLTRRSFCWRCDRFTFTRHAWCHAAFEMELAKAARRG
jgi:hypothetical protein